MTFLGRPLWPRFLPWLLELRRGALTVAVSIQRAWATLLEHVWARSALTELRRAGLYAIVLCAALGGLVALGVNLSSAFPSEQKPFGWPGPASFENGVAMVRGGLIVAASLPALLLGCGALRNLDPRRAPASLFPTVVAVDALLIWGAAFGAGGIGAWAAAKTPTDAYFAFVVAHGLLASAFWSIGVLSSTLATARSRPVGLAVWAGYVLFFEGFVRFRLFRTVGYHALKAGAFPGWFYAVQILSPIAAYRGALIFWRPGFRDYEEHAVLDNAALPEWLAPRTFVQLLIVVWVLIPLWCAFVVWQIRSYLARRQPTTRPHAVRTSRVGERAAFRPGTAQLLGLVLDAPIRSSTPSPPGRLHPRDEPLDGSAGRT